MFQDTSAIHWFFWCLSSSFAIWTIFHINKFYLFILDFFTHVIFNNLSSFKFFDMFVCPALNLKSCIGFYMLYIYAVWSFETVKIVLVIFLMCNTIYNYRGCDLFAIVDTLFPELPPFLWFDWI